MITYPGLDPITIGATPGFPVSPLAGTGVWMTVKIAEGGDKRNAANLMAAVQALADRMNYGAWRMINIVDGGTYTRTATINLANTWWFTGVAGVSTAGSWTMRGPAYLLSGATLQLGDGGGADGNGYLTVKASSWIKIDGTGGTDALLLVTGANGYLRIEASAKIVADSTASVSLHGTNQLGDNTGSGTCTQKQPYIKSGTKASTELRVENLPAGGGAFTASEADIWLVPTGLAAARTWTPATEAKDFEYVVQSKSPLTQAFQGNLILDLPTVDDAVQVQFLVGAGNNSASVRVSCRNLGGGACKHLVEHFYDGYAGLASAASASFV